MKGSDIIDGPVFDGLLESIGRDREFLDDLLQTYFEDSPNLLGAMHAALVAGNADEFRRAAHSLKSNSKSFGATELSRMCKELEDMGKAGTLDRGAEGLVQAEAEYARVRAELARMVGSE
jgi:HPt (histidine-containing phosphotransfer) domain-containing protein